MNSHSSIELANRLNAGCQCVSLDSAGLAEQPEPLHDLSMLVEGRPPAPDGAILAAAGCAGRVVMWRAVAGVESLDSDAPAWPAIRAGLMELPPRLRRVVGQELETPFQQVGVFLCLRDAEPRVAVEKDRDEALFRLATQDVTHGVHLARAIFAAAARSCFTLRVPAPLFMPSVTSACMWAVSWPRVRTGSR